MKELRIEPTGGIVFKVQKARKLYGCTECGATIPKEGTYYKFKIKGFNKPSRYCSLNCAQEKVDRNAEALRKSKKEKRVQQELLDMEEKRAKKEYLMRL